MKSRSLEKRKQTKGQSFDKEKIFIVMKGQKINMYDKIQEGREDTEIYPTLEKYGCIDVMKANFQTISEELTEVKGLRDMFHKQQKAREMWERLPLDVRQKFNNNHYEFVEKGETWLKSEIKKSNENAKIIKQEPQKVGETNE